MREALVFITSRSLAAATAIDEPKEAQVLSSLLECQGLLHW